MCLSRKLAQVRLGTLKLALVFNYQNWLKLSRDVDECKPLPDTEALPAKVTRAEPSAAAAAAAFVQGLTLVHFSARLKRFELDTGCV